MSSRRARLRLPPDRHRNLSGGVSWSRIATATRRSATSRSRATREGWLSAPSRVHRDDWRITACPVNGPAIAAWGAPWPSRGSRRPTSRGYGSPSLTMLASFAAPLEIASGRVTRSRRRCCSTTGARSSAGSPTASRGRRSAPSSGHAAARSASPLTVTAGTSDRLRRVPADGACRRRPALCLDRGRCHAGGAHGDGPAALTGRTSLVLAFRPLFRRPPGA
jgi:hypothetical protein